MKFRLYRKGHGAFELTVLVLMVLTAFIFLPCGFCSGKYESARRSACVNNLKQLGLALAMYSNDYGDWYPPIDGIKNNFMFEARSMYPEYFSDASILACPAKPDHDPSTSFSLVADHSIDGASTGTVHADCMTDESYTYLGWVISSDEEAEKLFKAYDDMSPTDYGKNILDPDGASVQIYALDSGSNLHCFTGSIYDDEPLTEQKTKLGASQIPIIWDRPYTDPDRFHHHDPKTGEPGGHVLYLDGHVEFVKYGEKFPMTETMARLLEERPRTPLPDCEE